LNINNKAKDDYFMGKYVKENLSQLIRRAVRQKKLTLRQVQQKSGGKIDESYVSRIMTGNVTNITLDKLVALACGIGEDPHTLFTAYYGRLPRSESEPQDVFELDVQEFVSLMQEMSVNPDLVEIMRGAVLLRPEECAAVIRYVSCLNERKRMAKKSRKK
jgi:transcriptional regulator with XRE-family HTH domain